MTTLNGRITDQDRVWSINTLKDCTSPGADKLIPMDFTIINSYIGVTYNRRTLSGTSVVN